MAYQQERRPPDRSPQNGTGKQQPPQRKLPVFEVLDLHPVQTGNLLAFFSVRIGPVTVHKWRLIQQDGQTPWVSAPQEIWTDDAGARRYKTLFEYPKEWRQPLTSAVIAAWQDRQKGGDHAPGN